MKRQWWNSGAVRLTFWRTEGAGFLDKTPGCQWREETNKQGAEEMLEAAFWGPRLRA